MMTLTQRYRRLTLWNKVGVWGSVASLIGLLIAFLTLVFDGGGPTTTGDQSPIFERNKGDITVKFDNKIWPSWADASKPMTTGDRGPVISGTKGDVKVIYGITEDELITELGVTRAALKSFFKILEEKHVPPEDLPIKLREIAAQYKGLQDQLNRLEGEDPDVIALRREASQVLETGDFQKAEKLLEEARRRDLKAIEELEQRLKKRHFSGAATTSSLGSLKMIQLAYADAAVYYREAADLVVGYDEERQATYLNDEGTAWRQAGQYAQALSPLEQALHLRENALDSEHPDVASSLNNLALLYWAQGLYDQAEPLYKRALAIAEKVLGPD